MAKRVKRTSFAIEGFDARHYRLTESYAKAVERLYDKATYDISKIAADLKVKKDKTFTFDDFPTAKLEVQKIVAKLSADVTYLIKQGSQKQWLFACEKDDKFLNSIMDTSKLSKARLQKYQDRNLDALKAFQERKTEGLQISDRVWKYAKQYKDQIETAIDVGIGEGKSAQQLSRDVRQNLKEPNKLFRRVRNKYGNLVLSKNAKAFNPGQGIYRSSYKNAMRLTRTEINMAYREADWLRWQQLDFVVGYEIRRSNHEPKFKCKVCERLKGKYPKWFKFKGWHPQCMCYVVPILMDNETYNKKELSDLRSALHGKPYNKFTAKNQVDELPDEFKSWMSENMQQQKNWRSTPIFVKDNFNKGLISEGLKYDPEAKPAIATEGMSISERSSLRHQQRTDQQKIDIQDRWDERRIQFESKLKEILSDIETMEVEHRRVSLYEKQPEESKLIEKVGGGDTTEGSCSSLALAYAANLGGMEVLDFRGGNSRKIFSRMLNICSISKKIGGVNELDVTGIQMMKKTTIGKTYYLAIGSHAAIVRRTDKSKYEYLELQSPSENGWKKLDSKVFGWRFGARGRWPAVLIDIDDLNADPGFKKLVGYINTAEDSQNKSQSGSIK